MYETSTQMFTIHRHSPFTISYNTTFRNTEGILLLKILTHSINIFIQNFTTLIQVTERYLGQLVTLYSLIVTIHTTKV